MSSSDFALSFGAAITDAPGPATPGTVTNEVTLVPSATWSAVAVEVSSDPPADPPPLCDCTHPIDVAGIVANGAAQNDDASIGLDQNVLAGPTRALHLDLPCGQYYLSGIASSHAVSIAVHGNTVLYVGGDIKMSAPLEITVDPTAELSVFVGGELSNSAVTVLGSAEVPAQSSFYVGGTGGVVVSSLLTVEGALYVPSGIFKNSNEFFLVGSLFADGITSSGPMTLHYDEALQSAGASCGPQ